MENNTLDILICGFKPLFLDFARQLFDIETQISQKDYKIIVIGESGGAVATDLSCGYIICPQSMELDGRIKCGGIITCGMDIKCTLSFSSIDYDKALLSINRRIDFDDKSIHQCEKPVDYYEQLSVYENLVLQGLNILTM
ncbi:MAG: hypothetical protein CVU97_06740 [Firmicutes bacterium HGW-Firmicutes-21]|nr:MAG: hypothetical protein CVU97_06740 [Firmicutes bacterium HGW-Firmicutes-21]